MFFAFFVAKYMVQLRRLGLSVLRSPSAAAGLPVRAIEAVYFRFEEDAEAVEDGVPAQGGEREDVAGGGAVAGGDDVGVVLPDIGAADAELFCAGGL